MAGQGREVARAACCLLALGLPVAAAKGAIALDLQVHKSQLENGLTVIVEEDHSQPTASCYIFYRAGSRNERPGMTGMAHLFEHMMFNGGANTAHGKFDEIIEGSGGSTNGYTTRDYTVYLESFPADALETILSLEADRMANLAITPENLEQERGIVKEERRLRVDNDTSGRLYEELYLAAFVASPYRWNPIGFMRDLDAVTLDQAREYFRTYYAPNNAVLVISGAVDVGRTMELIERYFGPVPRQPAPPAVMNAEPEQRGPKWVKVRMPAELPAIAVGFKAVAATHEDRPALDVLQTILESGRSSRLYRRMVRERELATAVSAYFNWGMEPELFWFYVKARPGKTASELAQELLAVISELQSQGPTGEELRKAKNQLQADHIRGMKRTSGKANELGTYEVVFGDYREIFKETERWEKVSASDVVRVAQRYLREDLMTTVELEPQAARPAVSAR